ncbi:13344_t:CDS:2 [Ambispora gerdemannii]|uniref:13344_t:CDS:1 n=1 Tax=Ambispora gerdemannii TaxID=144530 RepID=A0A9N8YK93_9GLOM|nr:13344_t:CDS:2 [Ambispora gerdemannii]
MKSEKDLTKEQKEAIVYGHRKNDSYHTIVANVDCRKSIVDNIIRRFCESGTDIKYVSSPVKHNPSQMHWSCFSWYGTGPLVVLNNSITGNVNRDQSWFQQGNARLHTFNATSNFFKENKVRVLDWSIQSPDLNPIKNALRRKPNSSNLIDLECLVQEVWCDVSSEF